MTGSNIASVSWGDHLLFGKEDGRLATPDALARRLEVWRDDLGCGALHWRAHKTLLDGHFEAAPGYEHPILKAQEGIDWNDLALVPALAHRAGMKAWLYLTLFDEGWPLLPEAERAVSYHNAMHYQHTAWQSAFSKNRPQLLMQDITGEKRQGGVFCLAYPEVRAYFLDRFIGLIAASEFDGLFICLRSQSKPAEPADQFGYNDIVRDDYRARYGAEIGSDGFMVEVWRALLGGYLTTFLRELSEVMTDLNKGLAVGCARGEVIGPPLGNGALEWRTWVEEDLIDQLVVNQNSSRCPSMWHDLWPMHRGEGYVQNYLDGTNLPPLADHLRDTYAPRFRDTSAELFVARQWDERNEAEEAALNAIDGVSGQVFSTFRHDNPGPLARGDWRA